MRLVALAIALSLAIVPLEAAKNKVHHVKVKKNKFNGRKAPKHNTARVN